MVMMIRTSLEMSSLSLYQQTNSGIMGDHEDHHHHPHPLDSDFVPYSSDDISSSSESDLMEDGSSSGSSSPISPKGENGPLADMSSLLQQLPFKRGLSKHFNGKSQSFGSLSNVTCLEDLAKPENPYNKKIKYSKSYMGLSAAAATATLSKSASSKLISKKSSTRGSCSSHGGKRNGGFVGNSSMRPPTHPPVPHRSNSAACFSNHTPLFA